MNYFVTWEIDIEADNPEAAAREAWKIMREEDSIANCFKVFDENGEMTEIDLWYRDVFVQEEEE